MALVYAILSARALVLFSVGLWSGVALCAFGILNLTGGDVVPDDLTHFSVNEFSHPEIMDVAFCRWLDRVRDRCGVPWILTDAGRLPIDRSPTGSAGKHSLHMQGRAVDIRSRDWTAAQKWLIVEAIMALASEAPGAVELEMVYSSTDRHLHLGVDDSPGATRRLIEADE